jgi:hypothetical protein
MTPEWIMIYLTAAGVLLVLITMVGGLIVWLRGQSKEDESNLASIDSLKLVAQKVESVKEVAATTLKHVADRVAEVKDDLKNTNSEFRNRFSVIEISIEELKIIAAKNTINIENYQSVIDETHAAIVRNSQTMLNVDDLIKNSIAREDARSLSEFKKRAI